jgi:curli production assembly/transport component CsgE
MKIIARYTVALMLLFTTNLTVTAGVIEDEISGFTIDNTITRIGHDFSRFLSDYRSSNLANSYYNLTVHERPSARWGNLIWVTKDHQTLYRRFIQPSNTRLKETAEDAAQQIHNQIKQLKLKELFSDNFDIDKDEI